MKNIEQLKLSDNFDIWRDKINSYISIIQEANDKVSVLESFPPLPSYTSEGLILTNKNMNGKHQAYWEDLETLLNNLGLTVDKDETTGDITGSTINATKITASTSITCTNTKSTGKIKANVIEATNSFSCGSSTKKTSIDSTGNLTSTGTIKGSKVVATTSLEGQGLKLSYSKPYIYFFFNKSTTKTSEIIETDSGNISVNGTEFSKSQCNLNKSDLRFTTTTNDVVLRNKNNVFSILYGLTGTTDALSSALSVNLLSGGLTFENGVYSDLRILPVSSNDTRSFLIRNANNKAQLLVCDGLSGVPNSLSPLSINMTNGGVNLGHTLDVTGKATFTTAYVDTIQTSYNGSTVDILTNGKIYNAVYNDYAEFFEKGEETEVGDIIALDTDSKEERYIKATNPRTIVGVHSDSYGHILGGFESIENSEETFIPVGMSGRVKTKIIGAIEKGDEVVLSKYPGIGRKYHELTDRERDIIGFAVETNLSEEVKLVRIKI